MDTNEITFDEIMAYDTLNSSVYKDIVASCKREGIIPFVGAGLSVPAGFKSWNGFLEREYSSHSRYLGDATLPEDPLVAATKLCQGLGEAEFRNEVSEAFGGKLNDDEWRCIASSVENEAVAMLPKLFQGATVTTNFDRLLEHIYPVGTLVTHPGHYAQINQAFQSGSRIIFKLHGCISEPEEIIFTEEAYNKAYPKKGKKTEFIIALEKVFTNKTVLFLGCSLENDETIKRWTRMIHLPGGKGIVHYAIINTTPETVTKKRLELSNRNIRPILYDSGENNNNHAAVRIILEHLYQELNTPEPKSEDSQKSSTASRRNVRHLLFFVLPALVVLLSFFLAYFAWSGKNTDNSSESESSSISSAVIPSLFQGIQPTDPISSFDKNAPPPEFLSNPFDDNESTVTFTLTASVYSSDAEFNKSVPIIAERIRSMTDKYELVDNGNHSISVTMLRDDLGVDSRRIEGTIEFICGVGSFYVYIPYNKYLLLDKSYIIDAEIRTGKIDLTVPERRYIPFDWDLLKEADTSNMNYIHVTVNRICAEGIYSTIFKDDYDQIFILANCVFLDNRDEAREGLSVGLLTDMSEDCTEFNIVMLDPNRASLNRLVATTLKQFSMPCGFTYKIHEDIVWEKIDNQTKGLLQQDEIDGSSVTMIYEPNVSSEREQLVKESFSHTVSVLKKRMDTLGNPYAIGYPCFHENRIAIKTSPAKLGYDLAVIIGSSGDIALKTPDNDFSLYYDIDAITIEKISDKYYSINVQLDIDSSYNESTNRKKLAQLANKSLLLSINNINICITDVESENTDGVIKFDEFIFSSHKEMSERSKFILDLLQEIVNGEKIYYTVIEESSSGRSERWRNFDLNLVNFSWSDDNGAWGVDTESTDVVRIKRALSKQFPNVSVYRANGNMLAFVLNLEISDDFPQRFLELVEEIYVSCDLDKDKISNYNFTNDNTDIPEDRFRVYTTIVQSNSNTSDDKNSTNRGFTPIVSGATFRKYKDTMNELLATIPFFRDAPTVRSPEEILIEKLREITDELKEIDWDD